VKGTPDTTGCGAAPYRRRALSDVELHLVAMEVLEPGRFQALLESYYSLLGDTIMDAGDAIERAERGQRPHGHALSDPVFRNAYRAALRAVRTLRRRREAMRPRHDRMAAALLGESWLREREETA
jgi:hypothetical protein